MASAQHQAVTSEACRPVNQWKSSKSATNYPFVYFLCLPYLGGDDLNLEPLRDVKILPAEKPGMRVGLVDCGLPLCRTTWTHAQFSWEIDPRVKSRATTLPECPHPNVSYESVSKSPAKLLKSNAVDPLVIDHSRHDRAASFFNRERRGERVWTDWLTGSLTQLLRVLWKSDVKQTSPRLFVCQECRTGG
jgi:hypothetical protein